MGSLSWVRTTCVIRKCRRMEFLSLGLIQKSATQLYLALYFQFDYYAFHQYSLFTSCSHNLSLGPGYGPHKLLSGDPLYAGRFSIYTSYSVAKALTPLLIPPRIFRSPTPLSLPPTSRKSRCCRVCICGQWPAAAIYPYHRIAPIDYPAHRNCCRQYCDRQPTSISAPTTTESPPSFVRHRHCAHRGLHPRGTGVVHGDRSLRPSETRTIAPVAGAGETGRRRQFGFCFCRVRRFDMGHTA